MTKILNFLAFILLLSIYACDNDDSTEPEPQVVLTPEQLIEKRLDAYNKGDIDGFLIPYAEDIKVYNFPNSIKKTGKTEVKSYYLDLFKLHPEISGELLAKTIMGDVVVCHEKITGTSNQSDSEAIAIYMTKSNKIAKVYLINKSTSETESTAKETEKLVQEQLEAYNNGDIDAFLNPYAEDLKLYNFPNTIIADGKAEIGPNYKQMFDSSPNLNCKILKRIVMGNTVIDHERITGMSGNGAMETIAIYKIHNNKISKVYFLND